MTSIYLPSPHEVLKSLCFDIHTERMLVENIERIASVDLALVLRPPFSQTSSVEGKNKLGS